MSIKTWSEGRGSIKIIEDGSEYGEKDYYRHPVEILLDDSPGGIQPGSIKLYRDGMIDRDSIQQAKQEIISEIEDAMEFCEYGKAEEWTKLYSQLAEVEQSNGN